MRTSKSGKQPGASRQHDAGEYLRELGLIQSLEEPKEPGFFRAHRDSAVVIKYGLLWCMMKYWRMKVETPGYGHLCWYEGHENKDEKQLIESGQAELCEVKDVEILVGNPHYENYAKFPKSRMFEIGTYEGAPLPVEERCDLYLKQTRLRVKMTRMYSWAVPTPGVIAYLRDIWVKEGMKEIGAGSGYFARMVTQMWDAPDYYAFDNYSSHVFPYRYYNVLSQPPETARNLFFCWPSYGHDFAVLALQRYEPHRVLYIGEGGGGCTADDDFHTYLNDHYDEVEDVPHIDRYEGLHDRFEVWIRKT